MGLLHNRVFALVNEQMTGLTGYTREELVGQSARLLYADDAEFERVGAEKYSIMKKLGGGTVETTWRHRDGHLLEILLSSSCIDLGDESAGTVFTALDITDRKQSEMELRQYRDHLEQLVNLRTAALVEVNAELNQEIAEHEATEKALRDSEARFRAIFEEAPSASPSGITRGGLLPAIPPWKKSWAIPRKNIAGLTAVSCSWITPGNSFPSIRNWLKIGGRRLSWKTGPCTKRGTRSGGGCMSRKLKGKTITRGLPSA
jgi:PAS domain S-box-containing protein